MCGQSRHIKKKCLKGGAGLENGSESQTNTVTFDDKFSKEEMCILVACSLVAMEKRMC